MFNRRYLAEKCKKVQLCGNTTAFVCQLQTSWFQFFIKNSSNPQCEVCIMQYLQEKTSLINSSVHGKAVQHVKRKLQFVPVSGYVIAPKWFCLNSERSNAKKTHLQLEFPCLFGFLQETGRAQQAQHTQWDKSWLLKMHLEDAACC